ncbi:MAG: pyridoxal-phosphate dependent enzyme [Planctomycetota bacterium]|nr:MAG: pyridoxal-phosphate dependent enzyme [Planctomycetota bacterium]
MRDPQAEMASVDVEAAARRLRGVIETTPLQACPTDDPRTELRLKLECRQITRSFKVRGAWNQMCRLSEEGRRRGVVATSSGNHAAALAWAAQKAGVPATLFMPADAYPNKIEACRSFGAEVVLSPTREEAEQACAERVKQGFVLVHPYDDSKTVEGAGTVGLEIAQEWPEVEVVLLPVGGGGLSSGSAIAIHRTLGEQVQIFGIEPEGAPSMALAVAEGRQVDIQPTTAVQGLCPVNSGLLNLNVCRRYLAGLLTVTDEEVFASQARLVNREGLLVEPAGAAAAAALFAGKLPQALWEGRSSERPLRVAAVVSGGNPDPAQLAALKRTGNLSQT